MRTKDKNGRFTSIPTDTIKNRFYSQIEMIPESGCWIWTGSLKNQFGHGAFKLGSRNSKVEYAHRYSWILHNGSIPDGMCVCHKCDVPSCVNPEHLFLGTSKDNVKDKVSKGRHVFGSKAHNAKLTENIVKAIKNMTHLPTQVLSDMYGVSRQSIADIIYGRTWRHV